MEVFDCFCFGFLLVGCDIVNHLPMSLNLDGDFPKGFLENNSIHYSDDAFKGFTKSENLKIRLC